MNGFTFSPALGWVAGGLLAAGLAVLAILEIALFVRRRASSDETVWACIRRTLMLLIVAVMVLTPSVVSSTTSQAINATDVIVAVDTTGSMAVADATYGSEKTITRIDAARQAVHDVTAAYPDASFAALRFGASGTLDVPLTPDAPAIDNWANTLAVEATSVSAGSSLDAPIDQLLLTVKSIREAHPDDAIVLYLITDGEQTSNVTRRTFSSLRQYLNDGFTVGVGSTEGGKIPVIADGVSAGDSNTTDHWVVDPDTGEPGISKMDEKNLKDIADEISGTYVAVNASQTLADSVSAKSSKQWRMTTTVRERTRTTPVVWPLAIALAILLAMEVGASDRNLKETAVRNSNEIHENDGSANTRMRAKCPLWARIVLACGAVLLLLVAGVAAVNLSASITFNQATASLNANIKAAQDESTDITTLKAQQQQTDAQFNEAGRMRTLLLPQVKDAIDTNASISSELTKITLKQAEAQNSGSDSGQAQSAQQSENSSSNAKKGGALTDEQKKQVEELMKANQQSTDTQSNTTQSEQKATQNKGTGATKPW